ncbi:MAG: ornithine--oxo-acid transaminase [Burkholderiales bacterium]
MSRHAFDYQDSRDIQIIGAAWGIGAPDHGCVDGPSALQAAGLMKTLQAMQVEVSWLVTLSSSSGECNTLSAVSSLASRLAAETAQVVHSGAFPLVLGGDHSCGIGTWQGVHDAAPGPIGLLWIDAHLDSHTLETTQSNHLHGMPLACLLGHGAPELTRGRATLAPQHVCVVGARHFEPDEAALLTRLGVRVFAMAEIARRGLDPVLQEALAIVQSGTVGFGLTIDLDVVDPRDAPGVSTPAEGGIRGAEFVQALQALNRHPALLALEIAEYNPHRDVDGKTARLVQAMLAALLQDQCELRASLIEMEQRYGAHNYDPLPVVLARGQGVYLWDVQGRRYLDMMSAYSAVSLGHAHPRIMQTLTQQAQTLAVTSRAFYNNRLPVFLRLLSELTGFEQALPVNTGLEAVETALKAARKWAHKIKGVPDGQAEIIACEGNFHGRSTTIVSLSSEPQYRDGFGPLTPGFKLIPYGDAHALAKAITANTAAFLVEPVQGEAGIVVPPRGYLAQCARICRERNVLLICDEVQTGLGRTGKFLACEHENVKPNGVILGKALGGGVLPVSAFLADNAVMQVFTPGDHGSTFGGNPLAAAVALETLNVIVEERLVERSAEMGSYLIAQLRTIASPLIRDVRGLGLFVGVEIDTTKASARAVCECLAARGVLSKDTHGTVLRFAPPLTITRGEIDWGVWQIGLAFSELDSGLRQAA